MYTLELAWRGLIRNKALTLLMMLAVGLGIGASMTMLTLLHVMTADPLPGRSSRVFYPQVDPQGIDNEHPDAPPPATLTYVDAMNLLRDHRATRQAAMTKGEVRIHVAEGAKRSFLAPARYTTADFFSLFAVPFADGSGWRDADDSRHARVVVIDQALATKVFGNARAVGQSIRLGAYGYRVVGVIKPWNPVPHFYDLVNDGAFGLSEQVYIPLESSLDDKQPATGSIWCYGADGAPSGSLKDAAHCAWLGYWAELDTPRAVSDYRQYLVHYSQEQHALGRFERPPHVALHDVMGWLDYNRVIPGSVELQALLAVGFMLVCLVNTVALLLVKFLRRHAELSVRRAMGATQANIFAQLLGESALIGVGGGVLGLLLAWGGLWVVRQQPADYANLAHLDTTMLLTAVALAAIASAAAGIFPAWRACALPPSKGLKLT